MTGTGRVVFPEFPCHPGAMDEADRKRRGAFLRLAMSEAPGGPMTFAHLCRAAPVSDKTLRALLAGERGTHSDVVAKVAVAVGVTPGTLDRFVASGDPLPLSVADWVARQVEHTGPTATPSGTATRTADDPAPDTGDGQASSVSDPNGGPVVPQERSNLEQGQADIKRTIEHGNARIEAALNELVELVRPLALKLGESLDKRE